MSDEYTFGGMGVWDNAFENAGYGEPYGSEGRFADGAEWGAGWAFAIVGMFEAMRRFCDDSEFARGYEHAVEDLWNK